MADNSYYGSTNDSPYIFHEAEDPGCLCFHCCLFNKHESAHGGTSTPSNMQGIEWAKWWGSRGASNSMGPGKRGDSKLGPGPREGKTRSRLYDVHFLSAKLTGVIFKVTQHAA